MQLELLNTETKQSSNHHKAASYTGIYGMHKYWSKKPYNIINHFIKKYSEENEIVMDPFCGSGISVVESIFSKRKAIGIDINPSAVFITKQFLVKIKTFDLLTSFETLRSTVSYEINCLYDVYRDNKRFQGTHFIWDDDILKEVWYFNKANKKTIDFPDKTDIKKAESITLKDINSFYPKDSFFHNPRINAYGTKNITDLFTPRNLYALSLLYQEIENIKDKKIKEVMKFCFTAALGQTSKMVFIVKNRGKMNGKTSNIERKEVGSWAIGYWTPKEYFEINVWNCFNNRFKRILKAKGTQEYLDYEIKEAKNVNDLLNDNYNLSLLNKPAQNILKKIPDNSIDYIITDPPHGDRIPYLELSMLWNSWLKKTVNYENEIIVSNSKERKKDIVNYNELMNNVYSHIYRVLKPNKHFSLMFNSLDDKTWENLITHLTSIGFVLDKVETLGYSANSIVQDNRKAALKTDFVLTFMKPIVRKDKNIKVVDDNEKLKNELNNIITNNGVETYDIINQLFHTYLNKGLFFKLSKALILLNKQYIYENNKWNIKNGTTV